MAPDDDARLGRKSRRCRPSVIAYERMSTVERSKRSGRISGRGRTAVEKARAAVVGGDGVGDAAVPAGGGGPSAAPTSGDPVDPVAIGARVRALRESASLSLRDLAERSGVSAPMLSQVERGETSPTLTVAARIASGLDLRLSQLLRLDESGAVTIVHARDRTRGGSRRRKHAFEVLTSSQPGQRAELSRHTLAPGGATGARDDPPMHEPGSREIALVERGSVVLVCDGQRYVLDKGDCVTFDADLPHHFENLEDSDASAEFLAVVSAGLRRS
jgi:XRE family transcriptional regulator, regulator of sulfur utilization